MILEDLGSLVIRVALGWLFITGAWASGKDKAGRDFTTFENRARLQAAERLPTSCWASSTWFCSRPIWF